MKLTKKFRGYGLRSCKKPKMSHHGGRTWDVCKIILPDGEKVRGQLDYTWGNHAYFDYEGQWYKIHIHNDDYTVTSGLSIAIDLRGDDKK